VETSDVTPIVERDRAQADAEPSLDLHEDRAAQRDPTDLEARLGLASTYARSGNYKAARGEYKNVLDRDPSNVTAIVGVAQTYHWAGAGELAREWYETALRVEPDSTAAQIGLGYVELWSDPAAAESRAQRLEQRLPGNADVERLRQESRSARAPEVMLSYDQLSDSNGNGLDTAWIETGLRLFDAGHLRIGAARYGMDFKGEPLYGTLGRGSIGSMYGALSVSAAPGQEVIFRLGVDRRNSTFGVTDYVGIGGASWEFGLGRRWGGSLRFDRDSFRYTTQALDEGIILNATSGTVTGRIAENWVVDGTVGYWDINDNLARDNSRFDVQTGIRYRKLVTRTLPIEAGYVFRHFGFEQDFGASFFSPSSYRAHFGQLKASGDLGSLADFQLQLDTGIQSYDEVSNEPLLAGMGMLGLKLGSGYRLEVFGIRGDYLLLSDFAVTTEQLGIRFRWKGGEAR
jgi:tetratricopeptide (TPR) repeat protein